MTVKAATAPVGSDDDWGITPSCPQELDGKGIAKAAVVGLSQRRAGERDVEGNLSSEDDALHEFVEHAAVGKLNGCREGPLRRACGRARLRRDCRR